MRLDINLLKPTRIEFATCGVNSRSPTTGYLDTYPEVLQNVRRARIRTSSDGIEACGASVDLTTGLDEIDNWYTGPVHEFQSLVRSAGMLSSYRMYYL